MNLLESITTAICAWTFWAVLMQPDMVFGFYGDWVYRTYNAMDYKWRWIMKPLGACGTCFAGQTGLWWFVFRHPDPLSIVVGALQTMFFFCLIVDLKNKLHETENRNPRREEI